MHLTHTGSIVGCCSGTNHWDIRSSNIRAHAHMEHVCVYKTKLVNQPMPTHMCTDTHIHTIKSSCQKLFSMHTCIQLTTYNILLHMQKTDAPLKGDNQIQEERNLRDGVSDLQEPRTCVVCLCAHVSMYGRVIFRGLYVRHVCFRMYLCTFGWLAPEAYIYIYTYIHEHVCTYTHFPHTFRCVSNIPYTSCP
jgi:hypothetical protein